MSLLSAVNLEKSFGPDDIFSGINLTVPSGARIALVGPNGVGKTTLLRLLVGLEEPSGGRLQVARNLSLGYLPQEANLQGAHTLWDECLTAVAGLRAQEEKLAQLEKAMSDPDMAEDALELYGKLQEDFERRGGYTYETRIRQTLSGLGFDSSDHHRPVSQLSGGQRTRAYLARLLLSDPDLLILDEPTNHLDIQAVEWLEGYLSQWSGSVLIVSHDRYFLDKVAEHIWEMHSHGLEIYRGNYSAYLIQRQERWENRQQVYQSEAERLEKELDYIKRNIAGQRTQQAKGKLRRLSREVQAIEQLGFETLPNKSWAEISQMVNVSSHPMTVSEVEHRIRSLHGPTRRPPRLNIKLKTSQRSGDLVLRTRDLAVGYPDQGRPLFRTPDLLLKRLECAAVIGPNGAGKTTFLKTLLGQMPPLEGEVILGASLNIGYFAQAHEDLRSGRTLMEEIDSVAPQMLQAEVRDYLARFLFSGDDVFRKVATLSGGERGRLALAKLSLTHANLLLLDEPTNHLDIPSQEILQQVLSEYQGTILLVSHDRYLIDALGTQIWEISPDQASLQVFIGSYTEFRAVQEQKDSQKTVDDDAGGKVVTKSKKRSRSSSMDRYQRQKLMDIEALIDTLEGRLANLSKELEAPPDNPARVEKLGQEFVELQEQLNELMVDWEKLLAKTVPDNRGEKLESAAQ